MMMDTIGLLNQPQGNVAAANSTCCAYDAVVAPSAFVLAAHSDAAALRSRGMKAAFDPNPALKLWAVRREIGWHQPRSTTYGTLRLG